LFVNTGDSVLLKDLHSRTGTRCNDKWVDLATLSDGDVLRLGDSVLQIAIHAGEQKPDGTLVGVAYADPLRLREALELRRADTGEFWRVEQAVAIIGRSPGATVRLDHPDVSHAHAAVFGAGDQLWVIDLDSRTGTAINGKSRTLSLVQPGDCLRIGPFDLSLSQAVQLAAVVPMHEAAAQSGADPGEALGRLREELALRGLELEEKSLWLERDQRTVEAARLSIEKERSALLRQAAVLREAETSLEARRRSLEQREKALRESLLRQAQGTLSSAGAFTFTAGTLAESQRQSTALH
jgi:pSer/pThr/pTyr-binding forkhead associated (FHA) protein